MIKLIVVALGAFTLICHGSPMQMLGKPQKIVSPVVVRPLRGGGGRPIRKIIFLKL